MKNSVHGVWRMNALNLKAVLCLLFLFVGSAALAQQVIRGKVTDEKGEAIVGASALIKGTSKGSTTDVNGTFVIDNLTSDMYTIVVSYIGFSAREVKAAVPGSEALIIKLEETAADLDEVVVTGLFDKRSRMESSVAISTLNTKQIERIAVNSAADLLKNIPGVYVNSALGEIRNSVYSRGVSVGSNDGNNGYYYVSMQEDGLPVTNATFTNYGPDYFLRTDATLGRLEAVRGGTASILGNNAPGGIFNYVSKTGGTTLSGEARAKFGLEGNGQNPYYRADLNVGGPLSKDKTLRFNIGGFWRQSDGARYPGYPMNNGGQVKANVVKSYKNGSLKLFLKYLNDHNAWFEFLPTIGFTDPHLPAGVTQTSSVLIPAVQADFTVNQTGEQKHFDSRNKVHSIDKSIGFNWEHNLGTSWSIDNKIRYSRKNQIWNTTGLAYPIAADGLVFYGLNGLLGQFGTYNYADQGTGASIGSITQAPSIINGQFAGINLIVNNANFPGASIQKNSLLFNPLFYQENHMDELIDQFSITKRLTNMSFTAGLYYAHSHLDRLSAAWYGASQLTSPRPSLTKITLSGFDGKAYQITNPDGVLGGSGKSEPTSLYDLTQSQTALFLGHNWTLTPKLDFDWGIRYEMVGIKGTNQIATATASTTGGTDGNPLTIYDNTGGKIDATYNYGPKTVNTFSFSGGLNYKYSENQAVYARYSQGSKAPDMDQYINVNTAYGAANLNPLVQKIQQIEVGYKLRSGRTTLFLTPFYSVLSNVPQQTIALETDALSSLYNLPVLFNKYTTAGIEIEANHNITSQFSVRGVFTFQSSIATSYQSWFLGENGKADDKILDFSGNKADNSAGAIVRISPTYTAGKFFASLDFTYMGSRPANGANAFFLPAYNQTNLNMAYSLTRKWQLQANINNVFNQNGVMGWSAPGGFPRAVNRQGFTKAQLESDPNAIYSTMSLPPRAYFLTAIYSF